MKKDSKFKRQLVSGGIYIALAAAVVTVTLNGVNRIIDTTELDIPEADLNVPDIVLELPENQFETYILDNSNDIFGGANGNTSEYEPEINVSDSPFGVDSVIQDEQTEEAKETLPEKENSETEDTSDTEITPPENEESNSNVQSDVDVSGEPDDVEYPTEPEPMLYGVYAKPADGYIDREFSLDELLYSPTMGDFRTHNGVDITGDLGSAVRSVANGTVLDVYYDDFYGYTVAISYGDGIVAYYMNLAEAIPPEITKGASVKTGQVIGGIGESAVIESADMAHLHFAVMRDGNYIDPGEFLRG